MRSTVYARLPTEQSNPRSRHLDRLTPLQIIDLMNREETRVLTALRQGRRSIAGAAELAFCSLREGGRLLFLGAGTSGRLGVLEAAECPPTFGTRPGEVVALMAGGRGAVFRSKEGAEDREAWGRRDVGKWARKGDCVIGIAASGVTPYVRSGLQEAKRRGCRTVLVTCNPQVRLPGLDVVIRLKTGPEVLAGSTRLKAGTACKLVLNRITLAAMVRLGKVYGNLMVDVQPRSRKLVARAERLISHLGRISARRAHELFLKSGRNVKAAIRMACE